MMVLDKSDSIKLVRFVLDKIDDKDKEYNNQFIELRKFKAINKESILAIDENYILLILEESSGKLRAATFGINGKPIESTLIYDNAFSQSTSLENMSQEDIPQLKNTILTLKKNHLHFPA